MNLEKTKYICIGEEKESLKFDSGEEIKPSTECAYLGPKIDQTGENTTEIKHSHPQHTQTGSNSSTIAADSSNGVTSTRCCRYNCMSS
jgi:hypothetical protein